MKLFILGLLVITSVFGQELIPEEAAQIEVIDAQQGDSEGIYIKVNGAHKDSNEMVYMQVNMNVKISNGNVMVNDKILPFSELTQLQITAQLMEVKEGVDSSFMDAKVKVLFFLHELTEAEDGAVARAFRLECQITETDQYDVHMFNVTEVVMHLDKDNAEIKRTVTLISETESKLHQARDCPMMKCVTVEGCMFYKKDDYGCGTCTCAAKECPMVDCVYNCDSFQVDEYGCQTCECEVSRRLGECRTSCDGVCPTDTVVADSFYDHEGCLQCPCLAIDYEEPSTIISCFKAKDLGNKLVESFEGLPLSLQIITFVLLGCIAGILTLTCCVKICCKSGGKLKKNNKNSNLKAYNCGKLQIYMADNEKKHPLIDNLDVVSADIA